MSNYEYIINPTTGKKVKITSTLGRKILDSYKNLNQYGSGINLEPEKDEILRFFQSEMEKLKDFFPDNNQWSLPVKGPIFFEGDNVVVDIRDPLMSILGEGFSNAVGKIFNPEAVGERKVYHNYFPDMTPDQEESINIYDFHYTPSFGHAISEINSGTHNRNQTFLDYVRDDPRLSLYLQMVEGMEEDLKPKYNKSTSNPFDVSFRYIETEKNKKLYIVEWDQKGEDGNNKLSMFDSDELIALNEWEQLSHFTQEDEELEELEERLRALTNRMESQSEHNTDDDNLTDLEERLNALRSTEESQSEHDRDTDTVSDEEDGNDDSDDSESQSDNQTDSEDSDVVNHRSMSLRLSFILYVFKLLGLTTIEDIDLNNQGHQTLMRLQEESEFVPGSSGYEWISDTYDIVQDILYNSSLTARPNQIQEVDRLLRYFADQMAFLMSLINNESQSTSLTYINLKIDEIGVEEIIRRINEDQAEDEDGDEDRDDDEDEDEDEDEDQGEDHRESESDSEDEQSSGEESEIDEDQQDETPFYIGVNEDLSDRDGPTPSSVMISKISHAQYDIGLTEMSPNRFTQLTREALDLTDDTGEDYLYLAVIYEVLGNLEYSLETIDREDLREQLHRFAREVSDMTELFEITEDDAPIGWNAVRTNLEAIDIESLIRRHG